MAAAYTVKTPNFEGPFDLLLDLVSRRKLFVNDVSLTEVTDDFIHYIEERQSAGWRVPLGESAEFILVASTLLLVKSRSLLPTLELTEEEEESIHNLEDRLALYARVKELSTHVKSFFGKSIIFEREPRQNTFVTFAPDSKTTKENLFSMLERILEILPKIEELPKLLVKKMVSLEEMIEKLAERISKAGKLSFKNLSTVTKCR